MKLALLLAIATQLYGCLHVSPLDRTLQDAERSMRADSTDLRSRYVAAIAERDIGKELLARNITWRSSREHFEWILKRDSLFEDVLWQYALLERYVGRRDHALQLSLAQIRLRPDRIGPRMGLYKLLRYYMETSDSAEFREWLKGIPGDLSLYFAAETMRRHGDLDGTDSLLTNLRMHGGSVSRQALGLSFARLRFQRGDRDGGEAEYWRAIDGADTELGAAILFEDVKYILSDAELEEYLALQSLDAKKEFFRTFWNFRNPSLALGINLRLQEHLRRSLVAESLYEYYGFRTRFNNPDQLRELRIPRAAGLNEEYNDMGLIYLRHGEPDDIIRVTAPSAFDFDDEVYTSSGLGKRVHMQPPARSEKDRKDIEGERYARMIEGTQPWSPQQDPAEAWLYYATAESPKMVFIFQKHSVSGNNWRLSSAPASEALMEELMLWDATYSRLFLERDVQRTVVRDRMVEVSKNNVATALSSEHLAWEKGGGVFPFPHSVDVFRADGGRSLIDISYAIPLAQLSRSVADSVLTIPIEVGVSLIDAKSRVKSTHRDTMTVGRARTRAGVVLNLIRYTVPPDSYAVSMHIRPLYADLLGFWAERVRVPDFSREGLQASSIQFLRPSTEPGALAIDGMKVTQSPFSTYLRAEPLYVYFQIYHLVADANGNTEFRTECHLLPRVEPDPERGMQVHRVEKSGKDEMAAEFYAIDVKSVPPGPYRLLIRITDRKSLQTTTIERNVKIVKPS